MPPAIVPREHICRYAPLFRHNRCRKKGTQGVGAFWLKGASNVRFVRATFLR